MKTQVNRFLAVGPTFHLTFYDMLFYIRSPLRKESGMCESYSVLFEMQKISHSTCGREVCFPFRIHRHFLTELRARRRAYIRRAPVRRRVSFRGAPSSMTRLLLPQIARWVFWNHEVMKRKTTSTCFHHLLFQPDQI